MLPQSGMTQAIITGVRKYREISIILVDLNLRMRIEISCKCLYLYLQRKTNSKKETLVEVLFDIQFKYAK